MNRSGFEEIAVERLSRRWGAKMTPDAARREAEEALRLGIRVLVPEDPEYPSEFLVLPDAPQVLFVRGTFKNGAKRIAVVGTRRPTLGGARNARYFAAALAAEGVQVVSGLARGIDTAAHEGALEMGQTIAILGSGLLNIYPPENQKLADRIAENGALISEFGLHDGPDHFHFPMRNRLISGLSRGVLIVEAPRKSGALITVDTALAQGKDVYVVPGNIASPHSAGSNELLKQGAACVTRPDDILYEAGWIQDPTEGLPQAFESDAVAKLLTEEPRGVDEMAAASGMPIPGLLARLAQLESLGLAAQPRPGCYVLNRSRRALAGQRAG